MQDTTPPATTPSGNPPEAVAAARWRDRLQRGASVTLGGLIWLSGAAVAGVVSGMIALALWAGSPLSLPAALRWASEWLADPVTGVSPLQVEGVRGSLLRGGSVERLTWTQDGLTVQVGQLHIRWRSGLWRDLLADRRMALQQLDAVAVSVTDRRPPSPQTEPPTPPDDLQWPWLTQVAVPLSVQSLRWETGTSIEAGPLRATYSYTPSEGHRVRLNELVWQTGRYRGDAHLEAHAPLRLEARIDATLDTPTVDAIPSQALAVSATLSGPLAGPDGHVDLVARVLPQNAATPTAQRPRLDLSARIHPWAAQPLGEATVAIQALNLAQFWPGGPTTRLDGQATLTRDPGGIADHWRMTGDLENRVIGPWNRQRLPVRSLRIDAQWSAERWTLNRLVMDLATGRASASGVMHRRTTGDPTSSPWQDLEGLEGELVLTNVDMADLWSSVPTTRLSGRVTASQGDRHTRWVTSVESGADGPRLQAEGAWAENTLTIDTFQAVWRSSRLQGKGRVTPGSTTGDGWRAETQLAWSAPGLEAELSGAWPWTDEAVRTRWHLRDAARFQRWVRETVTAADAAWGGMPLRDRARVLWDTDWRGGLQIEAMAAGAPDVHGWPGQWHAQVDVDDVTVNRSEGGRARHIRLTDTRLSATGGGSAWSIALSANANGRLEDQTWQITAHTEARAIRSGERGQHHTIRWHTARGQGHIDDTPLAWRLDLLAPIEVHVTEEGMIRFDPARWQVQPVASPGSTAPALAPEPMEWSWSRLEWRDGWLSTAGRAGVLPLSWANAWWSGPDAPGGPLQAAGWVGDLGFEAIWDARLPLTPTTDPTPPSAVVQWRRVSGDLAYAPSTPAGATPVRSGIASMEASARLNGGELTVNAALETRQFGQGTARWTTMLLPPDAESGWRWADDARQGGRLELRLPQLSLLSPFLPPGWRVEGGVQANAQIQGTRQTPDWQGQVAFTQLSLQSRVDGIDLSDGEITARLSGDGLLIERLRVRGAGGADGGQLTGQGQAHWRRAADGTVQPTVDLSIRADRFRVLARADRRLTLSGQVQAALADDVLDLQGQLAADQALLLLPDESTPRLGNDVVIRGSTAPVPLQARLPFQTRLQIDVDLGSRFEVRGLGLQTGLSGALRIEAQPGQLTPAISGDVRAVRGTYRAYGQRLAIERGLVRFNGPYDNPGLDILAVRPHPTQTVGVEIGGTAQSPRVRLYAEPDLPDSEKLAWLVLGRPASGAGAEAALLQQAALALISSGRGSGRDGSLAQSLGLDELTLQGESTNTDGSTNAAALTVGKRLTDQLYVSYSRSVTGVAGTVAVFLDVSRFLTLRAQAGDENTIDLIFTRRFDHWRSPRTIAPSPP